MNVEAGCFCGPLRRRRWASRRAEFEKFRRIHASIGYNVGMLSLLLIRARGAMLAALVAMGTLAAVAVIAEDAQAQQDHCPNDRIVACLTDRVSDLDDPDLTFIQNGGGGVVREAGDFDCGVNSVGGQGFFLRCNPPAANNCSEVFQNYLHVIYGEVPVRFEMPQQTIIVTVHQIPDPPTELHQFFLSEASDLGPIWSPNTVNEITGERGYCRLPRNDAECRQGFGRNSMSAAVVGYRPIFDNRALYNCRLPRSHMECEHPGSMGVVYDPDAPNHCRPPGNNLDCTLTIPERPIFDSSAGECRAAESAAECVDAYGFQPQCRPGESAEECLNRNGLVFDDDAGTCRAPQSGAECRATGEGRVHESQDDVGCASGCLNWRRASASGDCRNPTVEECAAEGLLPELDFCRQPADILECLAASGGGRSFTVIENGLCAASCDSGRIPDSETRVCRGPANISECTFGLGGTVIENGMCADSCSNERVAGDDGICRDQTQEECSASGEIVNASTGGCRAPANAAECREEGAGQVIENGVCAAQCSEEGAEGDDGVCPGGDSSGGDGVTVTVTPPPTGCAAIGWVLIDGACSAPTAIDDCEDVQGADFDAIERRRNDDGEYELYCAAACDANRVPGDGSFCRYVREQEDCAMGEYFDEGANEAQDEDNSCRAPANDAECAVANPAAPKFDAGACRELAQSDCSPSGMVVDETASPARCRAPSNNAQCEIADAARPVFRDGSCHARTSGDCPSGQVVDSETGLCRAPSSDAECAIADAARPVFECVSGCAAGERPEGGCRELRESDCLARNQVFVAATVQCRAPANDDECAVADPARPKFDSGACRALTAADCAAGETLASGACIVAALTQETCSLLGRVVTSDGGSCRAPQNAAECAGIGFSVIESGRCALACAEGRIANASGICLNFTVPAEDDSDNVLPYVAPALVGAHLLFMATRPQFRPDLGFSSDGNDGAVLTYGGRMEYEEGAYSAYMSASGGSAEAGLEYETGGIYDGGLWRASYRTRENRDHRDYELGLRTDWSSGKWEFNPSWDSRFAYDAEDIEWESSSAFGLDVIWRSHKWEARQNSGFAWNSEDGGVAPRLQMDIERRF